MTAVPVAQQHIHSVCRGTFDFGATFDRLVIINYLAICSHFMGILLSTPGQLTFCEVTYNEFPRDGNGTALPVWKKTAKAKIVKKYWYGGEGKVPLYRNDGCYLCVTLICSNWLDRGQYDGISPFSICLSYDVRQPLWGTNAHTHTDTHIKWNVNSKWRL